MSLFQLGGSKAALIIAFCIIALISLSACVYAAVSFWRHYSPSRDTTSWDVEAATQCPTVHNLRRHPRPRQMTVDSGNGSRTTLYLPPDCPIRVTVTPASPEKGSVLDGESTDSIVGESTEKEKEKQKEKATPNKGKGKAKVRDDESYLDHFMT